MKDSSVLVKDDLGPTRHEVSEVEFWRKVQEAFEHPESAEMRAERRHWDRTVSDGFGKTRR